MKILYIMLASLPLLNCGSLNKQESPEKLCFDSDFHQKTDKVSLDNPENIKQLDGRFVQVEGRFHYDFEDVAIYPLSSSNATEALWVNLTIPESISDSLIKKFDGRKVVLTGRVNLAKKGHLNGYMASLDSVFCVKQIK